MVFVQFDRWDIILASWMAAGLTIEQCATLMLAWYPKGSFQ